MEVNEAIEFINNGINLSTRNLEKEYLEKMDGIISLLKSLEAENKKLKKDYQKYVKGLLERHRERQVDIQVINNLKQENKALRKDKWELEGINEACRRENEAYQEMWKQLRKTLLSWGTPVLVAVTNTMERLEEEYLGGGE